MSSYNNIRKIKYTKNPTDVVALQEYIIFEDSHANEKYVVFRFSNNVNQRLFEIKFEVLQYDKDNALIEKSVVIHKDFTAGANELFVPNAKLKVNFECQSLEVNLVEAAFDRVNWSGGEFTDNSYRFETYAETVVKDDKPELTQSVKPAKAKKKNQKTNKYGFNIRNIFRRNKAVFPAVFNVFLCIVLVALVVLSTFYFKNVTGAFTIEDFIVKESSSGFVTVLSYNGDGESIEIPAKLEDYYVTRIGEGAFRNSAVKQIELKTERTCVIETGAFVSCKNLVAITSSATAEVTVMEGAFKSCTSLASFIVPTAKLFKKCFDGTNAIKSLVFGSVTYSDGKLIDLFNGSDSITLHYLYAYDMNLTLSFTEGVTVG